MSQGKCRTNSTARPVLPAAVGPIRKMAEGEGFEPPEACASTVFKTAAFDRSATSPKTPHSAHDRDEPRPYSAVQNVISSRDGKHNRWRRLNTRDLAGKQAIRLEQAEPASAFSYAAYA